MIKHTFLNKCNTIIKDSNLNTGLNPVVELNAGKTTTRVLVYFDLNDIKEKVNNGEYSLENLCHKLKMFNCGSINTSLFHEGIEEGASTKYRASSFDILALRVPYEWDRGCGFDYKEDYFKENNTITSTDGSNWHFHQTGLRWDEPGIYSYDTLTNDETLIISKQHFDSGTEDLELDVTNYVNAVLNEEYPNYGLCLMFSPKYEKGEGYEPLPYIPSNLNEGDVLEVDTIPEEQIEEVLFLLCNEIYYKWTRIRSENRFISFFGPETNTFFNPYLETVKSEVILDDRNCFHLGSTNKLFFFVSDNGEFLNLDELPICTIDAVEYPVKQAGKGIYYAEIRIGKDEAEADTILYDKWSNIVLNGEIIDDVEMEFVVLPMEKKVVLGKPNISTTNLIPSIYGINDKENIKIGNIREVKVDFIEEYSGGKKSLPTRCEYRLYVREGKRQITVFPYQLLERMNDEHLFVIDTNDLIPNNYFVDIKITQGRNVKHYEQILEFSVVDDVTNFNI